MPETDGDLKKKKMAEKVPSESAEVQKWLAGLGLEKYFEVGVPRACRCFCPADPWCARPRESRGIAHL